MPWMELPPAGFALAVPPLALGLGWNKSAAAVVPMRPALSRVTGPHSPPDRRTGTGRQTTGARSRPARTTSGIRSESSNLWRRRCARRVRSCRAAVSSAIVGTASATRRRAAADVSDLPTGGRWRCGACGWWTRACRCGTPGVLRRTLSDACIPRAAGGGISSPTASPSAAKWLRCRASGRHTVAGKACGRTLGRVCGIPARTDRSSARVRLPSRRSVRGRVSKHDRFFDRLGRRAPKKRCRRCRRKFTPPAGYTNLTCPPCRRIEEVG